MTANRKVITVDGLAASGKSTLAKHFAERLHYAHLNTGMLYRAVGLAALLNSVDRNDESALFEMMQKARFEFALSPARGTIIKLDGRELGDELFTPEVSEATSLASRHPRVRERLLAIQRQAFPGTNIVAEGRDVGTVVFPDADLKLFITASEEVRRERRLRQMARSRPGEDLNRLKLEIEREIAERDRRDTSRAVAPAVPAADAIVIDNSALALTATLESMYDAASKRGLI
ncbi:MAG: (d)CMP kinase [Oligoflexia bacterium]|nr:(d)CMP kinase [Oligoflexia bacterium]